LSSGRRRRSSALSVALAAIGCAAPPAHRTVKLALGGDTMFGRWKDGAWRAFDDPRDGELRARLSAADVALVNLETGLCDAPGGGVHQQFRLTAPVAPAIRWLTDAGVDVAIVANNHSLDCGPGGLDETARALGAAGIAAAGIAGEPPAVRDDVVVVAATEPVPPVDEGGAGPEVLHEEKLVAEIAAARAAHPGSIVVASLHWGVEDAPAPGADQRAFAHRLVDAGADVVYGHGPHVLQEVDGAIVYSAGDLRFDRPGPVGLVELQLPVR
jgi:poly-gamma-glutamate synthesis protein (capsule biosynthesis protein)